MFCVFFFFIVKYFFFFFFFFQAEDGIRDIGVTGVQTCALPISLAGTEQGSLGGMEVTQVPQKLAFLPGSPQEDQRVVELLVELAGLGVQQEGLIGPVKVNVAANQVVAGGEQKMGILLVVDEGDRLIQDADRVFG